MRSFTTCLVAALCLWVDPIQGGLSARSPSPRHLAERASAYVRALDEQLVSIVGRERHEQRSIETTSAAPKEERRVFEAEIAWVHMPALDDTLAVREVTSVDGRLVAPPSRLTALLKKPPDALSAAVRQLLDESAAHNVAPGTRNINFPTFALVFLRPENVERSRWKLVGRDGASTVLSFQERRRPSLVRAVNGGSLWAQGSVWIDAASGRVERIAVHVDGKMVPPAGGRGSECTREAQMSYRQEVTFRPFERLGAWLPERMTDLYEGSQCSTSLRVDGVAVYSDYRRFEADGRLLAP